MAKTNSAKKAPKTSKLSTRRLDHKTSSVGAASAIGHAGFRSELLAQYVFTSWGTVVSTPNFQDHGIDLHCTLTEQRGKRLLAKSPYTVQVKSNMDPWVFDGEDSVNWLIEHPLPLFLCVVHKRQGRICVYHTTPRFWVWGVGADWDHVRLLPTDETKGERVRWKPGERLFPLGAPILDIRLSDLTDEFCHNAGRVLETWIAVDNVNLTRQRTGILEFEMPNRYTPNEVPNMKCIAGYSKTKERASDKQFQSSLPFLKEALNFFIGESFKRGDLLGAAKALLVRRHGDLWGGLSPFLNEISWSLTQEEFEPNHGGIERLEKLVNDYVMEFTTPPTSN